MFRFDQAALPQLTIRKALIIVDFQNDFIGTEDEALFVSEPRGFVDRTLKLAAAFRAQGDVVWVQSRFEKIRTLDDDQIIVSHEDPAPPLSIAVQGCSQGAVESDSELLFKPPDIEAFLSHEEPGCVKSSGPGSEMPLAVKEAVEKGDLMLTKSHYSAFREPHLLRILRGKMAMEVFICGSLTNVGVHATALDAAGHGMTITIVKDCCGYRHELRQTNAIRNLLELTGCEIASSQEVINLVACSQSRPARSTESGLRTSSPSGSLLPTSNRNKETSSASMIPDIVKPMIDLRLAYAPPIQAVNHLKGDLSVANCERDSQSVTHTDAVKGDGPPTRSDALGPEEDVVDARKTRNSHQSLAQSASIGQRASHCSMPFLASKQSAMAQNGLESQHNEEEVLQRDLCEGDMDIIPDALPRSMAHGAFQKLQREVQWQRMSHQGGEVPRLVAVQGEVAHDGSMPVYRHPADVSPPLLPFSPTVLAIKLEIEKHLGHALNHVLVQFYRDGSDYISEHSDKTLDIVAGSFIANLSLGAERTMVLRTKRLDKDASRREPLPSDSKRKVQRAILSHNSLCRMGLQTNMKWMHAIRQDKRDNRDKSPAELAYSGGRISLTFRFIGTFLNSDETMIWGQGATGKTHDTARSVINGQSPEAVKMLRAFGAENHSSDFDWKAQYGQGFDVLHISHSPRFFTSGNPIVNMRISLQLAEYGINYAKGSMAVVVDPEHNNVSDNQLPPHDIPVRYVDNDASKTIVHGDLAIMLYLESCYGARHRSRKDGAILDRAELSKDFTRFQRGVNLLNIWQSVRDCKKEGEREISKSFKEELAVWDTYAAETMGRPEQPFMVGQVLCLADFAVWPVLHAIREEIGPQAFDGLENLQLYYQRVAALESAKNLSSMKGSI